MTAALHDFEQRDDKAVWEVSTQSIDFAATDPDAQIVLFRAMWDQIPSNRQVFNAEGKKNYWRSPEMELPTSDTNDRMASWYS